jgi:hypothetical protein
MIAADTVENGTESADLLIREFGFKSLVAHPF